MKTLNAIGLTLIIWSITNSLAIKIISIIYLIVAFIVELYVLGDNYEKQD